MCLASGVQILILLWGWWGYNPWWDLMGFSLYIVGWWNYNPGRELVILFFHFITLRTKISVCARVCTYGILDHQSRSSTSNHTVIQIFLGEELRDSSYKGYDQAPP